MGIIPLDDIDLPPPHTKHGSLGLPTSAQDAQGDKNLTEVSRERERVRDLLRYYTPSEVPPPSQVDQISLDSGLPLVPGDPIPQSEHDDCPAPFPSPASKVDQDDTPPERLLVHDPTLTAFAQLGAFRLNCQRSFISLMDHERQYILAEATQSVSLEVPRDTAQGDEIYLGARILDRTWGVCPSTIQVFTALDDSKNICTPLVVADQNRYVMNDLSAIEAFKNRPYVSGWPHMRFYAEVPIRSATGHVIGTYCVVDDKPRDGLDERGFAALTEIANTIMKHLQLAQAQHGLQRARKMINGLGKFIDGKSSSSEALKINPRIMPEKFTMPDGENFSHASAPSTASTLISVRSQQTLDSPSRTTTPQFHSSGQSSPRLSIQKNASPGTSLTCQLQPRERVLHVESRESIAAQGVRSLFLHAGGLIQDAIHLDGIAFVKINEQDMWRDADSPRDTQTEKGKIEQFESSSAHLIGRTGSDSETYSDLIASTLDSNEEHLTKVHLPQDTLRTLLRRYPSGHTFLFDEDGMILRTQAKDGNFGPHKDELTSPLIEERWPRDLLVVCPSAKAVMFYPLWDAQRGEWFAASLAWICDSQRILQDEDLAYLAAFGSSMMSEKSRLDALKSDRAKAEFISSVSHELRSPLHGILAGTEALKASPTTYEQDDVIRIIAVCGEVLLESVDQILEYSKFSNPKTRQSRLLNVHQSLENSDLSILVENVVNGVFSGYQHRKSLLGLDQVDVHRASAAASAACNVTIILTMEWRSSWVFASNKGHLRRILINLFGNALKYTPSGFIHVSLRTSAAQSMESQSNEVLLQVEDSGIGMSKSYVENKLYTPFVQENPHAAGTGLGLSIVRQLVHDIGGSINIQSEVGYGTVAKVSIPSSPISKLGDTEATALLHDVKARTQKLCVCLLGFDVLPDTESPTGILATHQREIIALQSSISTLVTDWFAMQTKSIASLAQGGGDLVIALRSRIQRLDYLSAPRPLIILEDRPISTTESSHGIFSLSQPVGPRKLARALSLCLEYQKQESSISTNRTEDMANEEVITSGSNLLAPETTSLRPPYMNIPSSYTIQDPVSSLTSRSLDTVSSDLIQALPVTKSHSLELKKPTFVLLVEDNPINLKILINHMKRAGEEYIAAQNGLEALELYHAHHAAIKLIFMDISMPVMDGLTATQRIRLFERDHSLPRTRIVAVTCFSSPEYQKDALKSGIDVFLVKPVPMKSLQPILDLDPRMEAPEESSS